jgi:hypothetical protein
VTYWRYPPDGLLYRRGSGAIVNVAACCCCETSIDFLCDCFVCSIPGSPSDLLRDAEVDLAGITNGTSCTDCNELNATHAITGGGTIGSNCTFGGGLVPWSKAHDVCTGTIDPGGRITLTGVYNIDAPAGSRLSVTIRFDLGVTTEHDFGWTLLGQDAKDAIEELCDGMDVELPYVLSPVQPTTACNGTASTCIVRLL